MDVQVRNRPGTWVISGCALTRTGAGVLLNEAGCARGEIVLLSGHENRSNVLEVLRQIPPARILFFLSPYLNDLLVQIKLLGWLMNAGSGPSVLLLCGTEQAWLFDTVRKVAGGISRSNRIRVMPAGTPINELRTALKRWEWEHGCCGPCVRPPPEAGMAGLSPRELQILQMTIEGISVRAQARLTGLSSKTLYTHRTRAIRKLQPECYRRGAYRLWQLFLLSDMNGEHDGNM